MRDIQSEMKEFWGHSCYAWCLAKLFLGTDNIYNMMGHILFAWESGYIDNDGFVSKPLKFIGTMSKEPRDIQKVKINKIEDIPNEPTIVEMSCPIGGSHFVICHYDGKKVILDFDPSGNSNSWKAQKFISWRKYLYD